MRKKRGMKYCDPEVYIHPAYKRQQAAIKDACQELGLVAFYPDYHGADRDKNTVLVYLPEDDEYNRELEKGGYPMFNYDGTELYRRPLWTFENTDLNGFGTYDFANYGDLDLRGLDECRVIKGAIKLAYYNHVQNEYIRSAGGILGIREADEVYNDLNRSILSAFNEKNGLRAYICKSSVASNKKELIPYREQIRNFECDFAIPGFDEELQNLLNRYNKGDSEVSYDTISEKVKQLKGMVFVWF